MPHNSDIGSLNENSRRCAINESLRESQMEIDAAFYERRYYMFLPQRSLVQRGTWVLSLFLISILFCHSWFTVSVPPMFLIAFRKWGIFCRICSSANVSVRKLNVLLILWILLCIFINTVFWKWLYAVL